MKRGRPGALGKDAWTECQGGLGTNELDSRIAREAMGWIIAPLIVVSRSLWKANDWQRDSMILSGCLSAAGSAG
jgi:hypothetical protein